MIKIYSYNNYYNRIIKKYDTVAEYDNNATLIYTQDVINFDPGNDINTEIIIGTSNYSGQGDYLLYIENNTIVSRWFVIDAIRTRKGQYKVALKRDLLADNYNNVLECPMIINKGMVNYDNPLVFNNEGMSFNQIKQNEILLRSDSNYYPYIVLYAAKGMEAKTNISVKTDFTRDPDEELSTTLDNSIYKAATRTSKTQSMDLLFRFTAQYSTRGYTGNWRYYNYWTNAGSLTDNGASPLPPHMSPITEDVISNNTTQLKNPLNNALNQSNMQNVLSDYKDAETDVISDETMNKYNNIVSRGEWIVKDSNGKYYRITIRKEPVNNNNVRIQPGDGGYTRLVNYIKSYFPDFEPNDDNQQNPELDYKPFYANLVSYTYVINAEYLSNETFTVDVDPTGKFNTDDSECTIMLFPYWEVLTIAPNSLNISKETQLNIARSIAREYTNAVIYDMQLLPYAPPSIQKGVHRSIITLSDLDSNQYTTFSYNNSIKGVMLWADVSNFSFDIPLTLSVDKNAVDYKIASNCDNWRLCSPNYNGQFEFNVAKNDGVESFNVDVTYRPYNPYIHINPNFKNLYGLDFNDARGLICQGDFSLPITGDKFAEYELQNKNYLNIFNREIQHMDFENNLARINATASAITGTFTGAATGGTTGGMAGGAYGAIAGATAGAAAAGLGGIVDVSLLRKQQKENKDLAIDMFNYQLGNVKALPYSLNKVTPLTYNNKIFPFVEYYTCTEEEKNILRNKIIYNSMTLDTISTISNIKTNYTEDTDLHFYQGTPIRLEANLTAEELYEIFNELQKGVYI